MGRIYKNQTALRISLDTKADLSTATAQVIKYKKPDGTSGQFTATNGGSGVIYYQVANSSDLDQAGRWSFWAYLTFTGGIVAPGEVVHIDVYNEGY